MQHATGEILTEETFLIRLEEEEKTRQEKKKNQGRKTAVRGRNKSDLKRKNKTSVDVLFLGALASVDENFEEEPGTSENQLRIEDVGEGVESVKENKDKEIAVHGTEPDNNAVNLSRLEEDVTYVLAMYEGSCFPGLVFKLNKKSVEVSCMSKSGLFGWKWPHQPDLHV